MNHSLVKNIVTGILLLLVCNISKAQFILNSQSGTYDSIVSGEEIYYQYSWDEPLEEIDDTFKIGKKLKAFGHEWDSARVSDGSLFLRSSENSEITLILDATGWDLMDKGWVDTINYPNLSPVWISDNMEEVEWRRFGFANELDSLFELPSTGSVKIKFLDANKVEFIYGEFAMIRPDLCFEGFGSLRPGITYIDENSTIHTWFMYGDPEGPSIDSVSLDTAFDHLPPTGQHISIDFGNTNSIFAKAKPSLKLYPNPAVHNVFVSVAGISMDADFNITTFEGRTVKSGKYTYDGVQVSDLKPGYYVFNLHNKGYTYRTKFVKAIE
ncbi:MAG: T9SS type A sorting domain-containing protein [Flavobacteriales bacterium]|nr:T9SS type A sorting domain-containing protein [Flavobacteriales bacterium]